MAIPNVPRNRQLYMRRFPEGLPSADDFEVREAPTPIPVEGQILVQPHYIGVDAALRLIMGDSEEFLFRVRPGDLIRASAVGEVVATRHPSFAVGDFVVGSLGAQSYALSDGVGLEKCDLSLAPASAWLGAMGVSGLTAYFALIEVCNVQSGQTVLVNAAAGAVGSIAGQIARLRGARTIGVTGSDEKCRWLVDELGFDAAINYHAGDLYGAICKAAPDRLDVIFDNVGGTIMDESLRWIALRGTVLLCGATSQYSQDKMTGPSNYIWLGTMRARLQGYVVYDYADRFDAARRDLSQWLKEGRLRPAENIVDGDVAAFPSAFRGLFEGKNIGKTLLRLSDPDPGLGNRA
jgi:NADPH-dependent curcumin reductase CurA